MRWGPRKLTVSSGPTRNEASAIGGHNPADDRHDDEQETRSGESNLNDRADLRSRASALHIGYDVHRGTQGLGFLGQLVGPEPHATGEQETAEQEAHERKHTDHRSVRTDRPNLGVEGVGGLAVCLLLAVNLLWLAVCLLLAVSLLLLAVCLLWLAVNLLLVLASGRVGVDRIAHE